MKGEWNDNALQSPEPELFWNTRGRAVGIVDKRKAQELLQQGFVHCEPGTREGQYSPIFDKGDLPSVQSVNMVTLPDPTKDIPKFIDEGIWL